MKNNSEKQLEEFVFELTTTQACNFVCSYCFENDCKIPSDNEITNRIDEVIERMKYIFDGLLKSEFGSIKINFWGGEPTLNIDVIKKVVDAFEDDERISFFIFTNGSLIEKLLPILLRVKQRFQVQLSYDGEPVNFRRKSKTGSYTTEIVRKAMQILHQNGIKFQIKSTIAYSDYHHLPEVWDDFKHIRETYGNHINYSVTVDYHHIEFDKYKDQIETALISVAKKELEYHKKTNSFLSNIFIPSKKYCGCGKTMLTIDVDGKAYYCHGCIYSDEKENFQFGNLFEKYFLEKIIANYEDFYDNQPVIDDCEKCVALTCLRCNVTKYESSDKIYFRDRWYDFSSQKELCKYYKLAGRIGRAMLNILKEE